MYGAQKRAGDSAFISSMYDAIVALQAFDL
jgi:hypothetical protein